MQLFVKAISGVLTVIATHADGQNVSPSAYGAGVFILPVPNNTVLSPIGAAPPAGMPDTRLFAAPAATPAMLTAYAAQVRYAKETAGITVNGIALAMDRNSRAMLTDAVVSATADSTFTTQWKDALGNFSSQTAAQIIALGKAVATRIATCFSTEATAITAITANTPTITTFAQVDSAFAGL
jgi:hypothetical protein